MRFVFDIWYDRYQVKVPQFMRGFHPDVPLDSFPRFCGAGEGLGELVVPDSILRVKIRPACFVHDISWCVATDDWASFHLSNEAFRANIIEFLWKQSGNAFLFWLRRHIAQDLFYNSVDTVGAEVFKRLKSRQRIDNSLQMSDLMGVLLKCYTRKTANQILNTWKVRNYGDLSTET